MASPGHVRVQYITVGLVLLTLFSAISPSGQGVASPSATIKHDSLLFTINPDRSVGVGRNTTTTVPVPQELSSMLGTSYSIRSSSNFSQQANSVVQTTVIEYQLPPLLGGFVKSINLAATQDDFSSHGSLNISTSLPVRSINVTYSTGLTQIQVNATAQLTFDLLFMGTPLNFASSEPAFLTNWDSTFGTAGATWRDTVVSQIQNATDHTIIVTTFNGTETHTPASALVKIRFVAVPSAPATDFVTVLASLLSMSMSTNTNGISTTGLMTIIQSALNLETGETTTLTYNSSTGQVVIESITDYASNLDARLNSLKTQYFQLVFAYLNQHGIPIPAQLLFLNSTSIIISKISTTSDLDFSTGTSSMTLSGLVIEPPTVGTNTNFTIPGLFHTIGAIPAPGANITLAGGSNATYQVKVVVPPGTPAPSSTTANSATWTNVQNAAELANVEFQLQHISGSLLATLLSPTGIVIEAVVAAAIIASVFLYTRKRRSALPMPVTSAGPAPGLGPSPTPPTP